MSRGAVEPARLAAADYLDRARRDGLWRGFPTLAGTSELWVSGFVATHLARADAPIDLAPTVEALLSRRGPDGGWSYGAAVPTDADSTAWCLSAVSDQIPDEESSRAREVLKAHSVDDSFATYRADSGIGDFVGSPPTGVLGWTGPHPDVAAAVLLAGVPEPGTPDEDRVLGRLVGSANATGLIPSYWWRGMLYASALTLRALRARDCQPPDDWQEAAAEGLAGLQREDGGYTLGTDRVSDPFTTAHGLQAWCHLRHPNAGAQAQRAAEALLAMQRDDGSWRGDLVLRIPAPAVVEPRLVARWNRETGGGNSYVPDIDGVFATAAALHALSRWSSGDDTLHGRVIEPARPARGDHEVLVERLSMR